MAKIIGIDLGTTKLMRSSYGRRRSRSLFANAEGARTTPSVVAFSKNGERLVGQVAKRQASYKPGQDNYLLLKDIWVSDYKVDIDGKKYSPQEISAMILQKLKSRRRRLSR